MRVETGIHTSQVEKTSDQKSSANEQHDRKRNFGDDEKLTQAATTRWGARTAPAFFERLAQVADRNMHGRSQAEDHAGEQREAGGKRQDAQVDTNARQLRQHFRPDAFKHLDAPQRQQQTAAAAGQREQQAFNEHLANQPEARGAERRPNGNLFSASRQTREEQIRQVDTGNQHDQQHRALKNEQRGLQVSDKVGLQMHHADTATRVGVRMFERLPARDD